MKGICMQGDTEDGEQGRSMERGSRLKAFDTLQAPTSFSAEVLIERLE